MQNTAVLVQVDKDKEKKWAQHFIRRGFTALEKLLTETAGQYCVGDEITLADCCLVPQVYNCNRFMVDLSPFPTIRRIDLALKGHPAFSDAHPTKQPDYPSGSHANYA
jgi:maleylacetoacetate isomerase